MSIREDISEALQVRLRLTSGVQVVLRNPELPPDITLFPAISMFYGKDAVTEASFNDTYPVFKREWTITLVIYYTGSIPEDDESAEVELGAFLDEVRRALYANGDSLLSYSHTYIFDRGFGELLKPHVGQSGVAIPFEIAIKYVDEIATIFA